MQMNKVERQEEISINASTHTWRVQPSHLCHMSIAFSKIKREKIQKSQLSLYETTQ